MLLSGYSRIKSTGSSDKRSPGICVHGRNGLLMGFRFWSLNEKAGFTVHGAFEHIISDETEFFATPLSNLGARKSNRSTCRAIERSNGFNF